MRTSQLVFKLRLALLLPILATVACGGGSNSSPAIPGQILPTGNALVARYNILPPQANVTAWVEFGTDTTYGRQTAVTPPTGAQGQEVNILVAGMKPSTTYHMRAHLDAIDGESLVGPDQVFTTGAIPSSAGTPPSISVTSPFRPHWWLLSPISTAILSGTTTPAMALRLHP
jgi:hypothetical protein